MLSGARRALFARHSHPLSAWSRWATTPLVLAPLWSRSPAVAAGVGLWFALNPVMTRPPRRSDRFATRAMLGEERWTRDRSSDPRMAGLNLAGSLLIAAAGVAAWRRRPAPAGLWVGASMLITLLSWKRYAAIEDGARRRAADGCADQK